MPVHKEKSLQAEKNDDTNRFFQDLADGVPIILLAAPAVTRVFPDYQRVFGFLRERGVNSFHNVLLRADITVWAYVRWLMLYPSSSFFSSPCAAVSMYIRKHRPQFLSYLMPVASPLGCTVNYLRRYRKVAERVAFLSPCVAKRQELREIDPQGYTITIENLERYIEENNIEVMRYEKEDFSDRQEGNGVTLAQWGGLSECLKAHLPDREFVKVSGQSEVYEWMEQFVLDSVNGNGRPIFAELYNCPAGCEGGTGVSQFFRMGLPKVDALWFWKTKEEAKRISLQSELVFAGFDRLLRLQDFLHFPKMKEGREDDLRARAR